jgi:hypothetical protein
LDSPSIPGDLPCLLVVSSLRLVDIEPFCLFVPAVPFLSLEDCLVDFQDGWYELNRDAGDQVLCLLPVSSGDSTDLLQSLASENGADAAGEQLIATVPTANGGTRRKHHRPWTLREVMTLVEGVARCGGGKWADIKKLAFSSVGYRTAVDLKVNFSPGRHSWDLLQIELD